jgi:hypothetical protein
MRILTGKYLPFILDLSSVIGKSKNGINGISQIFNSSK